MKKNPKKEKGISRDILFGRLVYPSIEHFFGYYWVGILGDPVWSNLNEEMGMWVSPKAKR